MALFLKGEHHMFAETVRNGNPINRLGECFQPSRASVIASRTEYICTNSWVWMPADTRLRMERLNAGRRR